MYHPYDAHNAKTSPVKQKAEVRPSDGSIGHGFLQCDELVAQREDTAETRGRDRGRQRKHVAPDGTLLLEAQIKALFFCIDYGVLRVIEAVPAAVVNRLIHNVVVHQAEIVEKSDPCGALPVYTNVGSEEEAIMATRTE